MTVMEMAKKGEFGSFFIPADEVKKVFQSIAKEQRGCVMDEIKFDNFCKSFHTNIKNMTKPQLDQFVQRTNAIIHEQYMKYLKEGGA